MSLVERPEAPGAPEESGATREATSRDIQHLLKRLASGEQVVEELAACGPLAAGPLREFLLNGEPTIAYQPRKMAVEALAALGAKQTLLQYLNRRLEIADPAARLGEQAVQAAAAKGLASGQTSEIREAILGFAEPQVQLGVLEALQRTGGADAIPYFVRALEDDACRAAAENALRALGEAARPALLGTALTPLPSAADERQSSVRRRASGLGLLAAIGVPAPWWPVLRCLLDEDRPEIVVAASRLAAAAAGPDDRKAAARRLLEILPGADWFMQAEVEALLVQLDPGGTTLAKYAEERRQAPNAPLPERVQHTLSRLQQRAWTPGVAGSPNHSSHAGDHSAGGPR
jgi:hypothetical protein